MALMVSWASMLHPFPELPIVDRVMLLKHSAAAFAILHTAQRSLCCSTAIVLPNDLQIPIAIANIPSLHSAVTRIQDELILPMRRCNVEEAEIAAMKALVLLCPDVTGLCQSTGERLREARDGLLRALFTYLSQMMPPADASVRLSNLLMLVPALYTISQSICENQQMALLFGLVDDPLRESTRACKDALEQVNKEALASLPTSQQLLSSIAQLHAAAFPFVSTASPLLNGAHLQFPLKVYMS